ncbi:hypothetical protein [Rhizobium chutanense]|uniref:hypothetical protein n=1 Tax=Rhizobium chutanense TaxID=2035448 RepID=UPI0018F05661|nr:hypothetical protein [Rhizobium chutanense]
MPRAFLNSQMRLCVKAFLALLIIGLRPAAATPPCPPQNELLAKAKTVVEARVKSLSIGESGLLVMEGAPTRMIRVDLEIKRVIKGKYPGKEAIVYGTVYPPGPLKELTTMALIGGLGGDDTFEWELARREIGDGAAFFSMSSCSYYKFPVYNVGPD